jgi:hypothetical protein
MEKLFYQTSDINLAATLLSIGFDIDGINPSNPRRVTFFFDLEKYPDIESVILDYVSNKLLVNPKEFISNRRELLSKVKESQRRAEI